MPLSLVDIGARRRIKAVKGDDAVRKHLGAMGFTEGAEVEIVNEMNGNLIIGVMNSRVAIDKDLARRIIV